MSLGIDIRSAPERRGSVGDPSSWSGTNDVAITTTGTRYTGLLSKTYTFTVDSVSSASWQPTTATITWADGEGGTGRFKVGSGDYTQGADILVDDGGLILQFGAGATINAAETFTVAVTAGNRLRHDAAELVDDGAPLQVTVEGMETSALDFLNRSWDGRLLRTEVGIDRGAAVVLDSLQDTERAALLKMIHRRHDVCLGENYDADTVFLWRGGGPMPMVGGRVAFTRTGTNGPFLDRHTALWRQAAANEMRVTDGPAMQWGGGAGTTNSDQDFHPYNDTPGAGTGWVTHTGTPGYFFDENIRGVLDPDGGWTSKFLAGTLRVDLDAGEAIRTNTQPAITSGANYASDLYIAGRGSVDIEMYEHAATPDSGTVISGATTTVVLDSMTFQRVVIDGAAGLTGLRQLRITANDMATVWLSAKQQITGFTVEGPIETDGSTASTGAERFKLTDFTLPETGSLSMWVKTGKGSYDNSGAAFPLFTETSASRDILEWTPLGTDRFELAFGGTILSGNVTLATDTWHHVVVTWKRSATSGSVDCVIYHQGSSLNSGTITWTVPPDPASAVYEVGFSANAHSDPRGWEFKEVRIDAHAWTAAEVTEQHERLTKNERLHLHRETGGRHFAVGGDVARWLSVVNPDRLVVPVELVPANFESDNLVTTR